MFLTKTNSLSKLENIVTIRYIDPIISCVDNLMYELSQTAVEQVSGAKPLSFFSSYALAQSGYNIVSSIGIGTAIGITCTVPALPAYTAAAVLNLAFLNLVNSAAGYFLSELLPYKIKG